VVNRDRFDFRQRRPSYCAPGLRFARTRAPSARCSRTSTGGPRNARGTVDAGPRGQAVSIARNRPISRKMPPQSLPPPNRFPAEFPLPNRDARRLVGLAGPERHLDHDHLAVAKGAEIYPCLRCVGGTMPAKSSRAGATDVTAIRWPQCGQGRRKLGRCAVHTYPTGRITIVVPFAACGGLGVVRRILAQRMRSSLRSRRQPYDSSHRAPPPADPHSPPDFAS
jgi:hypothetical protein